MHGWEPIFKPEGHDIVYAEMDEELKSKVSYRANAVKPLLEYLRNERFYDA